jgi:holliday junction DNA helicase RuvB
MISSSQKETPNRIISPEEKTVDMSISENILRPKFLNDYIGQKAIKKHLSVSIESARIRKTSLEHIILYGPPGLGKTTLANIIAHEMGVSIKSSAGPAIEKQSDLISLLSNLEDGDILFIDEIHRLRPQVEEILYTAMEDFCVDIMVGSGTWAQSVKLPIKNFCLIWATTKLSSLSSPLRDRFGNVLKLDFYNEEDIGKILGKNADILGLRLNASTLEKISSRSRGTPRIANRLLKIIRDYATIGKDIDTSLDVIFVDIGIDALGLDYLDRKYLETLQKNFNGWPTGLNTIASAIGEEEWTLEDVVEPYLLQIGFLERSPRGRKITETARLHITNN